ncbi:MAG TPA: HEAT repeat domain-containing protein [Gemmataceae bacterium]|nr:HEAT repeat domain-containing protein [Gemmataceae bacterium]
MHRTLLLALAALLLAGCAKKEPLTSHGKPVSYWVQALSDPDARTRKRAVTALGHVGTADPAAVPAVAGALKDRDPAVRQTAALALLNLGPDAREAVPALQEALKDRDPKVRAAAQKALERIQPAG